MKKSTIFVIVVLFIFSIVNAAQSEEKAKCKVTEVLEGDSFVAQTIGDNSQTMKIRIYGVDSPEEGQNFYTEAKQFLKEKIGDKGVDIEILTTDNLDYLVCNVLTEEGENISEVLIKEGYAWWDDENAKDALTLKKLCAEAIREKKGLWADISPLAPRDYRKSKGLTQISYKIEKKVEEKKEEEKEKTVLKAKGNEVYKGTFSSNVPVIDASKINFNETKIDPQQLLMKHTPTVALDESGKPIGLAIPNINQIPYANALGFQDGDIISSVNGYPITDFSQAMPLYEKLKGVKELNVQVIRGGKPINIPIRLP
ncbi:MAG TPA: thermonuclease family protein [Candidatus Hydrogenedens sp.]|mgnify:CR=1 FL=1|nr:thermonuclease family protein [Candidatus Hydrogenedens sp.]